MLLNVFFLFFVFLNGYLGYLNFKNKVYYNIPFNAFGFSCALA